MLGGLGGTDSEGTAESRASGTKDFRLEIGKGLIQGP